MPDQRPLPSPPTGDTAVSHLNNARQIAILLTMAVKTSPSITDDEARQTILGAIESIDARIIKALEMIP